ncbi:T-lymphocyte surface antigen Ly-9 [Camelus dromedarius]|uniref:T-lymphocyte surface antigen Ly-9 n=1 Tax=Camelus dromedarius TaxID=9838 RepID=A0A5N4CNF1_CAMDR|nr:T-lymphocyte surface antigen Ly-9 [Camelus dromedarius]
MGETVAGILGESITLPLALPDSQDIEKVVWMFNTTIISKKRGQEATVNQLIKFKDPDKNTMQISSQDYSLKIGQLKMEDAGPYHAYVCSNSRIISTERIILLIYRPQRSTKLWIGFSLLVFIVLCFGISGWYFWKQKRREPTASHTGYIKLSHGHEKLNTCTTTARQQPRHISNGCSYSSGTTVEDKERTEMGQPVNGKDQTCDLFTQKNAEHDSDSEGQAEYDLVTPGDMAPALVAEGETMYTQVFLNLTGKTPIPQEKESSATIYCSVQKPQMVRTIFFAGPLPQQNDPESPEIPTYENLT